MAGPRFTAPDRAFAASYAEALREGLHLEPAKPEEIRRVEEDFDGWLHEQTDLSRPVTLPDGRKVPRVPQTDIWLVDGNRFLGSAGIRHTLNESLKTYGGHIGYSVRAPERRKGHGRLLLEEALRVARGLGLGKVLLTCRDDNAGSIRLIEGAGGALAEKVSLPGMFDVPNRLYWIDLAAPAAQSLTNP